MARDYDRNYGDYRSRSYDRDNYRDRSRRSDRDEGRATYSGGRYFYEGRTYASDRNRPGEYGRGYQTSNWDRGSTYDDYPDRNYETDYDRDRKSRHEPGYGRGYTQDYDYDYDRERNRYGYSRDFDPSRDWDYDPSREYDRRGYHRYEAGGRDDSWNGYGYSEEDERRIRYGDHRDAYERGDYNQGEFERTSDYWRADSRRNEPARAGASRDEDWGRPYDRSWSNSSTNPNWQSRRELGT